MAKISAHDARVIAEARRTGPTEDGTVESIRTLCSDGRILRRSVWRYRRTGMRANSNGYVVAAHLRGGVTRETVRAWATQWSAKGWTTRIMELPPEGDEAMSKKVTTKVHGEAMQARKAKKAEKSLPPRREKNAERIVSPDDIDQQTATQAHEAAHVAPVQAPAEPKATAPKSAPHGRPVAAAEAGESDDAGELVVFAIRLTREERDAIHAVAGSGKATKLVRSLVVAAGQNAWIDTPTGRALLMNA